MKFNQISAFLVFPGIRILTGAFCTGGVLAQATDLWASGQVSSHAGVGAHGHAGLEREGAAVRTAMVAGDLDSAALRGGCG